MTYIDIFNRAGVHLSVGPDNGLKMEPGWLVTTELLDIAIKHKYELVSEIRCNGVSGDDGVVIVDYHLLMVAANLQFWEADDSRFGYEVMLDVCYRQLDPEYYAWLRHQMDIAKSVHKAGGISDVEYNGKCSQFRAIRGWALTHIGEEALRAAIRCTDATSYAPPSEETFTAYRQGWDEAWAAHERPSSTHNPLHQPAHIVPEVGKSEFSAEESTLLLGISPDAMKYISEVKRVFGGKLVPTDKSDSSLFANTELMAGKQKASQLVLGTRSEGSQSADELA